MTIADFSCIFALLFAACFVGGGLFTSRNSLTYAGRLCWTLTLSILLSLAGSFYLAAEYDFVSRGYWMGQIFILIVLFIFAMFLISYTYWQLYYSAVSTGDKYSYDDYAKWKKGIINRERAYSKSINESMDKVFFAPLMIFILTVMLMVYIYMPKSTIGDDYVVEPEAIQNATVSFYKTNIYRGLPMDDKYHLGDINGIEVKGVNINLVENRRDFQDKYWIIYVKNQTDEVKERLAPFFSDRDFIIFSQDGVAVYRSDGQEIR